MQYQLTVKGVRITIFDADDIHDINVEPIALSPAEKAALNEPGPPDCGQTEPVKEEPAEPKRVKIHAKWRDLNCKMKGEEGYTLAVYGERLVWLDQHPEAIVTYRGVTSRGIRASERHCHDTCEVPVGTVVIFIKKNGSSTQYTAGRVQEHKEKPGVGSLYDDDGIKHVGTRREGSSYVHIVEIDGQRREFRS